MFPNSLRKVSFSPRTSAFLALAALLLSACRPAEELPATQVRPVRVITVAKGMAGDAVVLTGTVQAQTEINLSFRIDGRLIERNVELGDTVRPGQLVARLDPQNEESGLQSARAQLNAARAQLTDARNNHARMRTLIAQDAVSRATYEAATARLQTAEAKLQSAQSQVAIAENRLSYTRLESDVAGIVTAHAAEPGEVLSAGRMVVQIARDGARDAVFDAPARMKGAAPANAKISVALVSDPNVVASGVVREVSPRADPITGTFRVRVSLLKPPAAMRLGSTVTGRAKLAAAPIIEIPPSAVFRSDRQTAVWVVDPKTETVATRIIEIRSSDPNRVEVAAGLNPDDVVVTAGVQALRPGQKVRLLETDP